MKRQSMLYPRISLVFFIFFLVFLMAVLGLDFSEGVLNSNIGPTLGKMWDGLLHLDLSKETLIIALNSSIQTLSYALVALSITVFFSLICGVLASGILFESKWIARLFQGLMRLARSIHELIWAWFFVYAMGNNPVAGLLALSIPYTGGLAKQYAEALSNVDPASIQALKTTGASRWQLLLYGYLPAAFMDMLTHTIFRFEMAVRSTTVLSFVGLGGLGFYIQLAAKDLNFSSLWTYLLVLIVLISLINVWANRLRKQVKADEN